WHPFSTSPIGPSSGSGEWKFTDDLWVVSHEAGHLAGLPITCPAPPLLCDEYNLTPPPHPQISTACIMMTTDPANSPEVLQLHVNELMTNIGASCKLYCCFLGRNISALWERVRAIMRKRELPHPPIGPPPSRPRLPDDATLDELYAAVRTDRVGPGLEAARILGEQLRRGVVRERDLAEYGRSEAVLDRWLTVMGLADARDEPAATRALAKMLEDEDVNIRVRAAAALVMRGERTGIPVLIDTLGDATRIMGHPPVAVATYAVEVLRLYTGQALGFDAAAPEGERARAIDAWRAWWAENPDAPLDPR
ncbi:MAG: HEAT repeat domain-containing protein, partial [Planctomycetota bacterium]